MKTSKELIARINHIQGAIRELDYRRNNKLIIRSEYKLLRDSLIKNLSKAKSDLESLGSHSIIIKVEGKIWVDTHTKGNSVNDSSRILKSFEMYLHSIELEHADELVRLLYLKDKEVESLNFKVIQPGKINLK